MMLSPGETHFSKLDVQHKKMDAWQTSVDAGENGV
jgi:hypothetical protein